MTDKEKLETDIAKFAVSIYSCGRSAQELVEIHLAMYALCNKSVVDSEISMQIYQNAASDFHEAYKASFMR
jgi:hypothetical protein